MDGIWAERELDGSLPTTQMTRGYGLGLSETYISKYES